MPTLFAAAELSLWIAVMHGGGAVLQFSSVILAFLASVFFFKKNTSVISTETALLFTVLADLCLVILNPIRQLPAMLFFSITQISYAVRLYNEESNPERKKYHVVLRIILCTALEASMLMALRSQADALTAITMFYFANLASNAYFAFKAGKSRLFAIGLLLFIACDLFVGLNVLFSDYLFINESGMLYEIINPPFNAVWFFYIPSQTLIALSAYSLSQK